jgi:hypothetical protein
MTFTSRYSDLHHQDNEKSINYCNTSGEKFNKNHEILSFAQNDK